MCSFSVYIGLQVDVRHYLQTKGTESALLHETGTPGYAQTCLSLRRFPSLLYTFIVHGFLLLYELYICPVFADFRTLPVQEFYN